jgi:DNA-3-methyladenine glycosylase II
MKKALVESYGGSLELEGVRYWAFPDYERLKSAKPSELVKLLRNQRTAVRIGSLIDSFPELDEEALMKLPYEKAAERLKKVNGIGDWSAQFILFRGLGRIERQQGPMKPVQGIMDEVYGKGRTIDDVNRMYGPWCGYWSLYLWGSSMNSNRED